MLNVYAGYTEDTYCTDIDMLFKDLSDMDWFNDEFVRELVFSIDKSTVISSRLIDSPVLGPIPPDDLSGGVKCLIMLYKRPDIPQRGSALGDNCLDYALVIGSKVNCSVYFDNTPFTDAITKDVHVYFPQVDKYANSKLEFDRCLLEADNVWRIQNKDILEEIDI